MAPLPEGRLTGALPALPTTGGEMDKAGKAPDKTMMAASSSSLPLTDGKD